MIFNPVNLGVGGTVKVDGDGHMDPALIPGFIAPIQSGEADYTKGNRFFNLEEISRLPGLRIFGNTTLSLMNKLSSGYWEFFDQTNGYTAIHSDVARHFPMNKISPRYFVKTDILFRLGTLRAVVVDIPMSARYGDEVSNLKVSRFWASSLANTCAICSSACSTTTTCGICHWRPLNFPSVCFC
ncbi:hypothetical protein PSCICP_31830 [Pseudomonas cichorii]|uniref:Uncharacterized protein n=1 Tax=Pseudomonas cichorii TaxID=36746 RepID=A0ABQ1DQE2_PSECI|nr:hypothetical protein PSCICP_31830 [Pseudomonas cichorii]